MGILKLYSLFLTPFSLLRLASPSSLPQGQSPLYLPPRHFWLFQSCQHPTLLPLPQVTPHPLYLIMESLAAITRWGRRSARVPLVSSLKVGLCLLFSSNAHLSSDICYPCSSAARNVISVTAVQHSPLSLTIFSAYLTSFDRRQSDYKPGSSNKICMCTCILVAI